MEGAAVRLLAKTAAAMLAVVPTLAQEVNDPANCPYCEGDPELMREGGVISHGGFGFGEGDTGTADRLVAGTDVFWIETTHFEIGVGLGPYKPAGEERKKLRTELERLREAFPEVNPKSRVIDPWLRTHLFAQRLEDLWDEVIAILAVDPGVFPAVDEPWITGERYWGEGPYLGQMGKFEVLILPTGALQVAFMRDQFGLSHPLAQRWNVVSTDSLLYVTTLDENGIRNDLNLHGNVVFGVVHNMLDGYKHYSYETPLWIKEGLAHHLDRVVSPKYNTYSFGEGGLANKVNKSDWAAETKKLVRTDEAPRLAQLVGLKSFSNFEREHHLACWSMTVYLLEVYPEAYACLNDRLHGLKDDGGFPDGEGMGERHREAFRDCLNMSYSQFDQEWREWVTSES